MASSSSFVNSIVISVLLMGLLALLFLRRLKNDLRKFFIGDEEEDKEVASSSSSSRKTYDVFLSFRGEDTRYNFVSHLHESLSRCKIETFIDDSLKRGEEISQSLLHAIEASRISLVIFSKNYASSKWCLKELAKIIECNERQGQIVIPVFYGVDPSHVRNQTGSYASAFTEHRRKFNLEIVKTWRDALQKAGSLAGWVSSVARPDAQLIQNIVSDVLEKLKSVLPDDSHGLVGINWRIEKFSSLLHLESSQNVRILGIWGTGGIGKTTIAYQIFKRICNDFEEGYFLENAKEVLKPGVLTSSVLPTILKKRSTHKSGSSAFFGEQFHLKRVLVILDDVDESMSPRDLLIVKEHSLGRGSRIILTSRDKHALQVADAIYEVEKLNSVDALELFNLHAFKTHCPSEFAHMSERVAEYAGGNPLALKVLGSNLFERYRDDWKSALEDLSQVSSREIVDVLRVSYDRLSNKEKKIFLYVAIFFCGEDMQLAKQILSSCFGEVGFLMKRLVEKALLAVNENTGRLEMHNLLRELGKKIITEESTNEINILFDPRQIQHILTTKKGAEAIEGMSLDLSKITELVLDSDAFTGMDRLKVLQFYSFSPFDDRSKVHLCPRGLKSIPREVRYLRWDGYPSKYLPVSFCVENLVSLELRESKVEQLWEGVQNVVNLKQIDLSRSTCLITLPDLSKAVNIEEIHLEGCESLEALPSSIQYLTKLKVLRLDYCRSLRELPPRLDSPVLRELYISVNEKVKRCPKTSSGNLKILKVEGDGIEEPPQSSPNELEELSLRYCPNLTKFPEVSANIRKLELVGTGIKEIPSSIEFCTRLTELDMGNSKELLSVPAGICKLKSLERLSLRSCSKLESFPEIQEPMPNLQTLDLSGCGELLSIPRGICKLKSLEVVYLSGCSKLQSFPEIQEPMPSLRELYLAHCKELLSIPTSIYKLKSLRKLSLWGCSKLESFPEIQEPMPNLRGLDLSDCRELLSIPRGICKLKSLEALDLSGCSKLQSFPEIQEPMPSLWLLNLSDCKELLSIPTGICKLKTLCELSLRGCSKLESFPEIKEPMLNLDRLDLSFCENLNCLPNGLHNLKSLRSLSLEGTAIKELPSSIGLLTSLGDLRIDGCKIGAEGWQQLLCLRCLSGLHLRSCDLMEIPISFCNLMHQLSELDLSQNNFETLPPDFHRLSKLQHLKLNECRRIHSLPELPESLTELEANDCVSLETISLVGRKKWNLLLLGNCCKLDQKVRDKLVADAVTGFKSLNTMYTLLPGSEVPEFFSGYTGKGSSITIKLPSNINHDHRQLYRIAVCFVFASSSASAVFPRLKSMFVAPTPAERKPISDCGLKIVCKVKDGWYDMSRFYLGSFDPRLVESDHVLMCQPHYYGLETLTCFLEDYPGEDVSFKWSFYDWNDDKLLKHCKVKKWGVRLFIDDDNINIC